ncbi:non-ribosomal peptide synthetase [Tahibacter caeni]|uniref:non-ribosomal peptide synthetase n=1 Tax=Tahibacter caeni TaxID=1453545 RepID=UPI0021491B93|nr:non-ribosomal peptide synthetase [Tahibacter caeni]
MGNENEAMAAPAGPFLRAAGEEALPLALAQRRIWFLSGLGNDAAEAYMVSTGARICGGVDAVALRRALNLLWQRHDALRARIVETDGAPRLLLDIAPDTGFALQEYDFSNETAAAARLDSFIESDFSAGFELAQGPLIRASLITMPRDEHVWLLAVHHLIFDGTSTYYFARELAELYRALRHGQAPSTGPVRRFADCIALQQSEGFQLKLRQQADFWREALRGAPMLSALPTDRPRGADHDFRGGLVGGHIDVATTARLHSLARRHRTSLFSVLLASWACLLQRLGQQDEVVVGISTNGRSVREFRNVVGCFLGTVPVRISLMETPAAAIRHGAEQLRAATDHQDLPFERIVEAAKAERNLAQNPLFQTLINWYGSGAGGFEFDGAEIAPLPGVLRKFGLADATLDAKQARSLALYGGTVERVVAKLDLTLLIWEMDGVITLGIEYAEALFDRATVESYVARWQRILVAFVENDQQPLARIPLVDESARARMLQEWNATEAIRPRVTLSSLIAEQMVRSPQRVALRHGSETLSYAELGARVEQLAGQLAIRGIGTGARVAVQIERGNLLVVALLAVLRCGAAYVPLDPQHPSARRQYAMRDASVRALLVAGPADSDAAAAAEITIDITGLDGSREPSAPAMPDRAGACSPAYVIYTSGTTGTPKGVQVGQAALVNLLLAMRDRLPIDANDRVLALTTISFDIAALEIFLPLLCGASVVIADRSTAQDPHALAQLIDQADISLVQATPTTWRMLLDVGWRGKSGLTALCGGEALPVDLAQRIAARVTSLWNVYGPTETTIWSTMERFTADADPGRAIACIGRPIANTHAYVLDRNGELLPPGVVGELYLGGDGLADGYVGLNELTQQRFLTNPFAPQQRFYRTGDLACWDRNGRLHHCGRSDTQIKLNGYRVELEEIEARLAEHAAVSEAVVVLRKDGVGYERLVAYYVTAGTGRSVDAIPPEDLRNHLLHFLPAYMVPEVFIGLEQLPVSMNGKIDRGALPAPSVAVQRTREAPQAGIENEIATIWSELLDGCLIDRRDNFFRIGGHSLLAVRVIVRLRRQLGVEMTVADLFANPTLETFAIAAARAEKAALPAPRTVSREGPLVLSSAQRRLWFLAQTGTLASRAYHMPIVLELDGELDRAALFESCRRIVARHETLRTTFALCDGQPAQRILAPQEAPVEWREFDTATMAAAATHELIAAEIARPFDLENRPPLHAALLRCSARRHIALFTVHHIACDGWSLDLFLGELQAHYNAARSGRAATMPVLPLQYADYAAWQTGLLSEGRLARSLDYWKQRLTDAPELFELPSDRPRGAQQDLAGDLLPFAVDAELTAQLRRLGDRCGATLFMTLLAGWAALMARLSGSRDFVIGMPVANRDLPETEALIGFFANTVALRFELDDDLPVTALVDVARREVLGAQQHRDLPFEHLVEILSPQRSPAYTPVFQIAFAWQSVPPTKPVLDGLDTVPHLLFGNRTAKFDLTLYLWEADGGLSGGIEFASALFDRATIRRYLDCWLVLLRSLTDDPQLTLRQLALLDAAAQSRLLNNFAAGPHVDYGNERVHRLVEAAARKYPDVVAVEQRARRLTYAQLQDRAERLERRLATWGIRAGDHVAVLLRRSPDLIVALLAVLRRGAAYVMLDPALPLQRLERIFVDSRARLLLVDEIAPVRLSMAATMVEVVNDPTPFAAAAATSAKASTHVAAERVDDIAYIVYTSGSTGVPKGMLIEQRGFANVVRAIADAFGIVAGDRVSNACGLAFDASTIDIWPALCTGATLVQTPVELAADADAFLRWWSSETLQCSLLPTPVAEIVLAQNSAPPTLRVLATGGAALTRHRPVGAPFRLLNVYGPAEATVVSTIDDVGYEGRITVGRPIANTRAYILDASGMPQPIGVDGELHIGGVGVGAGYLGLPEFNAQSFLRDPFVSVPDARMYRSGDRARWLADGRIEFLGRRDDQIKLRGMRVELGEIEAALAEIESVREAAVVFVPGIAKEGQIVAYVSSRRDSSTGAEDERIAAWQRVYDDTYTEAGGDELYDFDGWNSSYTGAPIARQEMSQWQQETVERIRALKPRRVLEIGCGSGLLLLCLAPDCERYVGLDFSAQALHDLQRRVDRSGIGGVALIHCRADELDRVGSETFDLIIVNSVVQYFPDRSYLDRVLRKAAAMLQRDGALFVGDVRNALLAESFHASVLHFREGSASRSELAARARAAVLQERELLIAPAYFREIAESLCMEGLRVIPKTTPNCNELTKYRYDVVLQRRISPLLGDPRRFDAETNAAALDEAVGWVKRRVDAVALVVSLSNALVAADAELVDGAQSAGTGVRLSPSEAVDRVRAAGLCAEPSWLSSDRRGRFHLLIAHDEAKLCDPIRLTRDLPESAGESTNIPAQAAHDARLRRELAAALAQKLPSYMVPAQFVLLPQLPLTPNGKVDRAALPPVATVTPAESNRPLQTSLERQIAAIWGEVLGVVVSSANDHFFALGGHSLAAVQVLTRLRERCDVEMTLADLFRRPRLVDFAEFVQAGAPAIRTRIQPIARNETMPLSFEQEGLWFLAKLPGAVAAYNMIVGRRLQGRLDVAALRRAFAGVVARHELLRSYYPDVDGRPVMRLRPPYEPALRELPLAGDAEDALDQVLREEIERQFDLESGPLLRVSLLRESDDRHVLLVSVHHIVCDGWSIDVLLRDLAMFYNAAIGVAAAPSPLPIQFADFVAAQRSSEVRQLERQADYWRETLAGIPPLLEVAADRLRPTQQDFSGDFLACRLDKDLSERIRAASRRFDTTPFVLLLASWAILLSRLSGRDDLVIGVPSANRALPETQELVGMLVSTLPLRLDLSGTPRLSVLLKQIEQRSLAAQQHQDIAFEKIVEIVRSERSLAYNPIFQVMFAWQGGRPAALRLHGVVATPLQDRSPRHAKFDLSLLLVEDDDSIHGGIEFATALFDAATIERYRLQWLALLEQFLEGDPTVDRMEWLSAEERYQVVDGWNATARPFPQNRCLHELFERQVVATPDAIALESSDERLSYTELDQRADRLAAHLRELGVDNGSLVAIHVGRSTAMIVGLLATLKAGAAYVPLDVTHPDARKAYVVADCRPGWLLHAGDPPVLDGVEASPQFVDISLAAVGSDPPARRDWMTTATALAYIIYTSGSTGLPKGVMVEHRSVVNRLVWMQREFAIESSDVFLQKTALAFDVSVWEIFVPLISGARLILAEAQIQHDPQRLAEIIRRAGVTVLHFIPSMLHLFLAHGGEVALPRLRHVVCSGEELPPTVAEVFLRRFAPTALHNLYGPTEASIEVTWHRCTPDHGAVRIPIGRPIDNCRLYVLDARHRPLPPGVPGELYIGGLPLARGYWNRPALTSERFLPDPFADDVHARMYKTGDQARWLANGEIDFLGRNDAQIKLRGFRIELSEIESHLARYPGVEEAAVALRDDAALGPSLVACWVGDAGIEASALRAYLAAAVPDYMVPAFFVRLPQLPLNANGKLDRNALPALQAPAAASTSTVPQGGVEQAIAAAWQDVLGRGGFGREDNFFALGGHSLLTLRLRKRLEAEGIGVEIADLFRYPTIAGLAAALAQRETTAGTGAVAVVRAGGEGVPLFLLHDGFGLTLYAHVLAARLAEGFPVYALDDAAAAQDESASITLLADRLYAALRAAQPQGPYRLAGWSFGGVLAYELATRLIDAGESVTYLGLIDSYYRFDEPTTDERPEDFAEVPLHVAALEPALRRQCLARHEIYALAARRHAARPLHLTVDLIKAQRCDFAAMRASRGWERVLPADALRLHEVPGCHYSMMTAPFVDAVAQALMRGLAGSAGPA